MAKASITLEIGMRLGKLVIIECVGINKHRYIQYKVKCDCGTIKQYSSQYLRKRTCCGCTINHRPKISKKLENISMGGMKIIKEVGITKHGHVNYLCKCECCEHEILLSTSQLNIRKRKNIKECIFCRDNSLTQIKLNDLTGKKIGKITIESFHHSKNGTSYWNAVCACGEKRVFNRSLLTSAYQKNQDLCCFSCLKKKQKENLEKMLLTCNPFKKNKIEKATEEFLIKHNVPIVYSFILEKYQYDFIVKDKNILIEVQGDYWHANPKIYKKGPIFKSQKEKVKNDKLKARLAKAKGYTILYIWESDIKQNNFTSLLSLI